MRLQTSVAASQSAAPECVPSRRCAPLCDLGPAFHLGQQRRGNHKKPGGASTARERATGPCWVNAWQSGLQISGRPLPLLKTLLPPGMMCGAVKGFPLSSSDTGATLRKIFSVCSRRWSITVGARSPYDCFQLLNPSPA